MGDKVTWTKAKWQWHHRKASRQTVSIGQQRAESRANGYIEWQTVDIVMQQMGCNGGNNEVSQTLWTNTINKCSTTFNRKERRPVCYVTSQWSLARLSRATQCGTKASSRAIPMLDGGSETPLGKLHETELVVQQRAGIRWSRSNSSRIWWQKLGFVASEFDDRKWI